MSSRSPWAKKKKKNNNKQNQHKKIRANNDQSASELVTGQERAKETQHSHLTERRGTDSRLERTWEDVGADQWG